MMDELKVLRQKLAELEAEIMHSGEITRGESRFRSLAEATPVMIWTSNTEAHRNFVNRCWTEYRGRALDQEVGTGWTEGLHSDDRDLFLETYLRAFAARKPFRIQYRLQRGDGEYRWVEDNAAPCFEGVGTFSGFVGSTVEVSNHRGQYFMPDETSMRAIFALTERERQVLVLISEGKSTKEAAVRLGISYKTADSHRSRILEKLGVHETASMVRLAIRAGLIEP